MCRTLRELRTCATPDSTTKNAFNSKQNLALQISQSGDREKTGFLNSSGGLIPAVTFSGLF
jgi:hypothetical protein